MLQHACTMAACNWLLLLLLLQVLGKGTIGAAGMPPEMVYTSGLDCVRKMVRAAA
jgi:hypothetical protein